MAHAAAVKASNWFYIVASQLGMSGQELQEALQHSVGKDALRDLLTATRKPWTKTLDKIQAAANELRHELIEQEKIPASTIIIGHAEYLNNSPLHVIKRPMSLDDQVIAKDNQRKRLNDTYTGVYDLYRKESGPAAYIRDKLIVHRLFRHHFPITLVSYVPDGQAPNHRNIRTYRGYGYFNNTVMTAVLGRPSDQRRFDLCTLFVQRTQTPAVIVLGGLLTSLTTAQGQPMAGPIVLCRTQPDGIDLAFPELWQRDIDRIVRTHQFEASAGLKRAHKTLLGDKHFLIGESAVAVEREFAVFAKV